ncbi:MAG TPA: hypothetical protein ENI13_01645 [candidate division CPR3 bacterium]|uniref:Uncharacterized protein n=1 Tax=candidate division CPR3 bacterium TaxID=2268181 RepID=A0A7C1NXY3_UNCC3|nr:hypothetical protein [candidate division CPR3 bacterium]
MKTFQIQSGDVDGIFEAKDYKDALRRALAGKDHFNLGVLVRFREVQIGHGKKIFPIGNCWEYLNPKAI